VMAFASHTEGMPNVVLEAMASGLPVVATPVGGIPELLAEGRTGRLVPVKDPLSLASAVDDLLAEPAAAREMGLRGRRFVLRHFDGRANARIALEIFRRVAGGGPCDAAPAVCANVAPGVLPIREWP